MESDFSEKFGIPRQSGLVSGVVSAIVFEPPFRSPDALRGIEGYSHLWLLWGFSENRHATRSLTVRPPRLGGNQRMGVFATRSPYRPNPIGLSSVRLLRVDTDTPRGPVLYVEGADLLNGTPIYDIKPYLAFTDSHPDATEGFAGEKKGNNLNVVFDTKTMAEVPKEVQEALYGILAGDPRPAYQEDASRIYGLTYADLDVRFSVDGDTLTVVEITKR